MNKSIQQHLNTGIIGEDGHGSLIGLGLAAAAADTQQWSNLHCSKDALTDFYGWMLQGLLAALAFTCLIGKRFCEPSYVRRSWETWWYDTSKQGIGAIVIHMTNVYLAPLFQGDPCTWYIINFLLDSTIGLFIIYVGIRVCQYLAKRNKWDAINFGEYTAPKSWIYQTWIYIGLMAIVKLITTLFIQLDFWDNIKNFILSPFSDAKIEVAVIMLVIPFFVNIFIFWVTDNFLMRHNRKIRGGSGGGGIGGNTLTSHHRHHHLHHNNSNNSNKPNLLQRVKVKYRAIRSNKRNKDNDSESEALISGDDELLIGEGSSIIIATAPVVVDGGNNLNTTTSAIIETKKLNRNSINSLA